MKYNITEHDKMLLLQKQIEYSYRLLVVDDDKNILDNLESIQTIGNYNINADSKVRRNTSFVLYFGNSYREESIEEKINSWIGYSFELQIGIWSIRDNDYVWYHCGYYLVTESNTSYSSIDNSLTTTLSDWYVKLDGTRNGQIGGAPVILIPNTNEDGSIVTIKGAVENLIKTETNIKDYIIDDIGEFYGMPQNNTEYQEYRRKNPKWNQLVYDLKYEAGCTVGSIFDEITNLYPNCQMYFDIYGNLCFHMIPSCEHDPVVLDNDYIQQIIVADNSESVIYPVTEIKNVTEVFGATYDIDRYASSCSTSGIIYTVTIDSFNKYTSGQFIAFKPSSDNTSNMKIKINNLDAIPLYYEYTETYVKAGEITKNNTYVFKISYVNGNYVSYFLGQHQPHALCVLTDNENDEKYSREYFSKKYNCDIKNVVLRVENGSPFTVQKKGEILDEKSGEEFDNILSDSTARENAVYFNRLSSSMYDTVTITTQMIPFLDVNQKVSYKKQQNKNEYEYIIKNIDNDTSAFTSTITMARFYPLYFAK